MRDSSTRSHDTAYLRRLFAYVLLGTFLLQVAWVLAVPTFRGADEFDHVYKADAAAAGQLRGGAEAQDGRGQLLAVRPEVVQAAGPMCAGYEYTGPDNCRAVAPAGDGRVWVASAAASYNPAYYVVSGTLARPLDGDAFVLAVRLLTAAVSALLLATAVATAASRARTSWPFLALAVSVTPTLVSSSAVAAPNGVGYAAAVLWWVSALAVAQDRRPPWWRLGVASVALVATHTLNVMWLPLMVLGVLALRPLSWWWARVRVPRTAAVVLGVALAALLCVAWVALAGTNRLSEPDPTADTLPPAYRVAVHQVVWMVQTVAIGPLRNEPEVTAVYAAWSMAILALLAAGVRAAGTRERRAMAVVLLSWIVVPIALTVVSYASEDFAWQGRYALPVVMGLTLLSGAALDRGDGPPTPVRHLLMATLGLVHVWCAAATTVRTAGLDVSLALADAVPVPLAVGVVALTALAGIGVLARVGVTTAAAPVRVGSTARTGTVS